MNLFNHHVRALWHDQRGVVVSIELVLVLTVTVVGLLVGLSAYRDAMVTEIDDVAGSVSELNQSYQYNEVDLSGSFGVIPYSARTEGSAYVDNADLGDRPADDIVIDASTVSDEG